MRYRPSIHSRAQLVKSIAGNFFSALGDIDYPSDELLVLNYHSTPKKFIPDFIRQIEYLRSKFNIIRPEELHHYYDSKLQSSKCSVLLTFDDGLKNNLYAAEALEQMNLRSFFFIVPGFLQTPREQQKAYYLRNIRPVINTAVDHEPEDFEAMSAEEISGLLKRGHHIGAHTFTHTLVASQSDEKNSAIEIVSCRDELERQTGQSIDSFCSVNNTLESVGTLEKKLIASNYRFHFTTLPGLNRENRDAQFIKRRNVECHWPSGAFRFAIGKRDLGRWLGRIAEYNAR